jgi:hypothetical protein
MRRKTSIGLILLAVVLGAIMGSALGQAIGLLLPDGVAKDFFLRSVGFGFSPTEINLVILHITLGLSFSLNIIGVIGIILAAYILRWYL